jgi:hypothetical protein
MRDPYIIDAKYWQIGLRVNDDVDVDKPEIEQIS